MRSLLSGSPGAASLAAAALLNFYQPRLPDCCLSPCLLYSPPTRQSTTNFRANSSLSLSKAIKISRNLLLLVLKSICASIGNSIYSYRYARSSMQFPIHSHLVQTSRSTKCLLGEGEGRKRRRERESGRETSADCVCALWRNQSRIWEAFKEYFCAISSRKFWEYFSKI